MTVYTSNSYYITVFLHPVLTVWISQTVINPYPANVENVVSS
jgi:hypothetical protein